MKNLPLCFLLMSLLWTCAGPQEQLSFFVEGNCEACGVIIEKTLKAEVGVASADWDFRSSFVEISYQPSKTSEEALQQVLSQAGFNTGYFEPDPEARASLPACCQEPITRKLQPKTELPGHD